MQTACGIGLRMMLLILSRDNLVTGHMHVLGHDVILFTSVNQPKVSYEEFVQYVMGCPYNSPVLAVDF